MNRLQQIILLKYIQKSNSVTLFRSDTDGPPAYVKETKDSKANQKHGDDGRALKKEIEESVN